MSTSLRTAFLFYNVVLFLSIGVGVYLNRKDPILGFTNGLIVGAVISLILYNLNKDKLTSY